MLPWAVDPEDTYNETPYEKGFAFVSYLRENVLRVWGGGEGATGEEAGKAERDERDDGRKAFNKWLESYATDFAFKSVSRHQNVQQKRL